MIYKNFLKVLLLIFLTIILLEAAALTVLYIKRNLINTPTNYQTIDSDLYKNLSEANKWVFYPSRWYTAAPNYKSKYVQTDMLGFRINTETIKNQTAVGFFGGSTMFSITTNQDNTIPGHVNIKGYDSLNFGQGGYSSNAELWTLIEAIRTYPQIKYAFFYDGVNEVARHLEFVQNGKSENNLYKKTGYYYSEGIASALKNSKPLYEISYKSNFLYLLDKVIVTKNINKYDDKDIEIIAQEVVDIYYENITDIRNLAIGRGVAPIFSWQPSIFTTNKKLTSKEKAIIEGDNSLIGPLYKSVTKKIFMDSRKKDFRLINLTNSLDELNGDVFSDWCHINEIGNERVASKISLYLKDLNTNFD